MKDSTKQRIFWIIIAVMLAAEIFAFSSQNTEQSEGLSDSVVEIFHMEQAEQYTRVSNQDIILGLTLRKLAHVFLYALLGFSLCFVFQGIRARFPFAVGTAFCYGILDEIHQRMSGRIGRWQDTLIDLGGVLIGVGLAILVFFLLKKIKPWFDKQKEHHRLEMVLDALSLASVLFYAIYRFLQSTMFQLYYSNRYKMLTIILPIVFGSIRFLYLVLKKFWAAESHKEQSFFILRCIFAFCLAIPFLLVGWMHDYKMLIYLPICCMCLYDMVPEKVCRWFVVTIGTCLAAVILCCLSGTVRNIVYPQNDFVSSYGIINTTDFASYFTFLLLIAWCGMRSHKVYASVIFAAVAVGISYAIYLLVSSRTAMYLGILIAFFVLWDCLEEKLSHRAKAIRMIGKGINWLSLLAFPAVGAFVVFLSIRYSVHDTWALQLETVLSGRLATVIEPFRTYGVHPFGSTVDKMYGYGRTILGEYWSSGYGYLDVGYAMLAIRYGWIITAIVAGLWIWMTVKALKNGKNRIAFSMAVIAVHAFSEARFLDVNYNIFLVMPFCMFSCTQDKNESAKVDTLPHALFVGIILIGIGGLFLPKALSWLRTFFYLNEWTNGTSAFYSLVFNAWLIFLLVIFGKSVWLIWENRNKTNLISLAAAVVLLSGSILAVNSTIERGRKGQAERLNKEEHVIQQILEAAEMPVYAAESEELYHRNGIALTNHVFSAEELGCHKGTILVYQDREVFSIILSGGQYTQISQNSGVYSYDAAVIAALSKAGYHWSSFYTGIHHCNTRDLALFNGLSMKDRLVLNKSIRAVTSNAETDQFPGVYKVAFSLSSFSPGADEGGILLEVLGESGERVLFQKKLTANDFDSDGRCVASLTYLISAKPCVSYAISTLEGACVTVDDISWQRIDTRTSDSYPTYIEYRLTLNAVDNQDGSYTFANNIEDNYFTCVVLDMMKTETYDLLPTLCIAYSPGHYEGYYTHTEEDDDYYIRLRGNANLRDEAIVYITEIQNNKTYKYSFDVDTITDKEVIVSNFSLIPANNEEPSSTEQI